MKKRVQPSAASRKQLARRKPDNAKSRGRPSAKPNATAATPRAKRGRNNSVFEEGNSSPHLFFGSDDPQPDSRCREVRGAGYPCFNRSAMLACFGSKSP